MCGEYRAGSHANECGGVGSTGQGPHANEQCVGNEVALANEIIAAEMSRTEIAVLMHVTSVCLSVYQSV